MNYITVKKTFFLILNSLILFLAGCAIRANEDEYIAAFKINESDFNQIVHYIDSVIISDPRNGGFVRKTVLVCSDGNRYTSTDYRMCDSFLEGKMNAFNISSISIEKSVCKLGKNFDLIIFTLLGMTDTGYSYYYHYSFCNDSNIKTETSNIKNVPLANRWSLFVEKN